MTDSAKQCRLGDVVTLKRGYDLATGSRKVGAVPVISSGGISGWHNVAKVQAPGVVTGRYGTLGKVYFSRVPFWPLNTSLYVRDFKGNNPQFCAALLEFAAFGGRSGAAAVPGVNRNDLHDLLVPWHSVEDQRKIAAILSAYDDLIENNHRRIEILEESARAIYREWLDEASPEIRSQWESFPVGDVLELKYGKALPAAKRNPGTARVMSSAGSVGWHDSSLAMGPGIVVGRKGNVGSLHWVDGPFWAIDTSYYVRSHLPAEYLYFALAGLEYRNTHAAVPGLNREDVYQQKMLVPDELSLTKFVVIAKSYFGAQAALERENVNLAAQRDLLLPKLISGELDVGGLDIDTSRIEEQEALWREAAAPR